MRFLRKFDVTDHDPVVTHRVYQEFKATMHTLFIDGYVLCNADVEVPGLGAAKTITQIAMDQCKEVHEFHYGQKVWSIWGPASKQECEQSLAEMRTVVQTMLARMDADFHPHDLLNNFSAMDLEYWLPEVIRSQEPGLTYVPTAKTMTLCRQARSLCTALGVDYSYSMWWMVIKDAMPVYQREKARQTHEASVDQRLVWARALAAHLPYAATGGDASAAMRGDDADVDSRMSSAWTRLASVIRFWG
jgi:hypothetical protein